MVGNTLTSSMASFLSAVRVFQGVTWVLSRRAKPLLPIKSFRIFSFGVHLLLTHTCPSCEYSCDNIYIPKDGGLTISVIHQVPLCFSGRIIWWILEDSNLAFSCSFRERPIHATPVSRTQGGRGHLSPHHSFYFRTTYITYRTVRSYPGPPSGIRTLDPLIKSQVLQPAELRAEIIFKKYFYK